MELLEVLARYEHSARMSGRAITIALHSCPNAMDIDCPCDLCTKSRIHKYNTELYRFNIAQVLNIDYIQLTDRINELILEKDIDALNR